MTSLVVVFWMFVILFGIIGAMRGWAKELMVTFSVILALFIISLLEQFVPILRDGGGLPESTRFWIRTLIIVLLVFFGYQTPNIRAIAGARFARERIQDTLLGLIIGAVNGYLVVGSIWYYMDQAGYPLAPYFVAPTPSDAFGEVAISIIDKMPPAILLDPSWVIYFAVAIAFLFVVVVFV